MNMNSTHTGTTISTPPIDARIASLSDRAVR